MNSQTAITLLKNLEQCLDSYCELNDEGKTAFSMAITALELFGISEQLPSVQPEFSNNSKELEKNSKELENKNGELISRQEAIDALKICDNNEDGINCHKCPLRDERWDGAWQDNETNCYRKLMRDSAKLLELPSAQPEREKGKWIRTRTIEHDGELYCNQCGQEHPEQKLIWNYCPNCGCRMEEGE